MIVVDGDGMLKMFWLDIVLAMFDTESKAERKQTAGNVVSTDKLIQHIKEYSGVKHNMLNIQEDFGLNIKIKDRVPIDSVIAKLGTQLVLTILCQNLELYIFEPIDDVTASRHDFIAIHCLSALDIPIFAAQRCRIPVQTSAPSR